LRRAFQPQIHWPTGVSRSATLKSDARRIAAEDERLMGAPEEGALLAVRRRRARVANAIREDNRSWQIPARSVDLGNHRTHVRLFIRGVESCPVIIQRWPFS